MSNTFFRFKQFTVHQDRCAMKVSTDACLFGAWIGLRENAKRVLDVGAGTGLLSLMLAQRYPDALFTALEIDANAAAQASENVAASPFYNRIKVVHADAREWVGEPHYDTIVSNPPFFRKSLLGPDAVRNSARHSITFSAGDFAQLITRVASAHAEVFLLLPLAEASHWSNALSVIGLNEQGRLLIKTKKEAGSASLAALKFGHGDLSPVQESLLDVYEQPGGYSKAAVALLQPYYLFL